MDSRSLTRQSNAVADRLEQRLVSDGYIKIDRPQAIMDQVDQLAKLSASGYRSPKGILSAWMRGDGQTYDSVCYVTAGPTARQLHFIRGSFLSIDDRVQFRQGQFEVRRMSEAAYLNGLAPRHHQKSIRISIEGGMSSLITAALRRAGRVLLDRARGILTPVPPRLRKTPEKLIGNDHEK